MMRRNLHQSMRTTLTLDEDVAAKLKAEVRRSGRSLREIVNEALRDALTKRRPTVPPTRFTVTARNLGSLKPGLSLDSVADLFEQIEGPAHR